MWEHCCHSNCKWKVTTCVVLVNTSELYTVYLMYKTSIGIHNLYIIEGSQQAAVWLLEGYTQLLCT